MERTGPWERRSSLSHSSLPAALLSFHDYRRHLTQTEPCGYSPLLALAFFVFVPEALLIAQDANGIRGPTGWEVSLT